CQLKRLFRRIQLLIKVIFLQTVGFPHLPFQTVSVHRTFETFLRNGKHCLSWKSCWQWKGQINKGKAVTMNCLTLLKKLPYYFFAFQSFITTKKCTGTSRT